jgi:hypothetical protein
MLTQPLFTLIEKVKAPKNLKLITRAIEKAGAKNNIQMLLTEYLLQNRTAENADVKLARLKNYLDPDKPLYAFLSNRRWLTSQDESAPIQRIRTEVAALNIKIPMRIQSTSNSSSAVVLHRLPQRNLLIWGNQFQLFNDIELFLKSDTHGIIKQLDVMDSTQQTLRNYLYTRAKNQPFILYMMLKKDLVPTEDYKLLREAKVSLENLVHDLPEKAKMKMQKDMNDDSSAVSRFIRVTQQDVLPHIYPNVSDLPVPEYIKPPSVTRYAQYS